MEKLLDAASAATDSAQPPIGIYYPAMSSSKSSHREFSSAFQPLPAISLDAPRWGERFAREMPSLEPPFYGVNVVDVRREHYDAIFSNIRLQTQGAADLFGGRLHFYSVTDYGEIRRATWIIYFETFPDSLGVSAADQASDVTRFPDIWSGSDMWSEFVRLAEGYTWWVTPALPANETP